MSWRWLNPIHKPGNETQFVPFRQVGKVGIRTHFSFALDYIGTKLRRRRNGERTRAVLLGAKAAGSGVGYGTKGPRTSRRFFFWTAVHRWISPIQPPIVFVTEISFFSLFPGIFWVIRSHAANSQIWTKPCRSSFLAGRKHTSSVRCVIQLCFLHLTGWTVDRKITSIRPASWRAACLSCVTTLQSEWLF